MKPNESSFWQYKLHADIIRGGSFERGVKRQSGCLQRQLSVLSLPVSSESLATRPTLLYGDMESVVGFPLTTKLMTLNDPEWLFYLKSCFRACRSRTFCLIGFRKQLRKANTDRPLLSATACILGTLVSGNIRFMRIFEGGFSGKEASKDTVSFVYTCAHIGVNEFIRCV